jgi:hypothetical protein
MALDINWNALQAPDIGGAFNQGYQQGQQRRREEATDNALRALIANPNDPNVVNDLARYDPRMAYEVQGQQQAAMRTQQEAAARRGAARGDPQALEELAGINFQDYLKLDERSRKAYKEGIDTIANVALMADTPEEWDAVARQLAQADPEFGKYIGRFDLRQSVIAQAGQAKQFIEQNQPRYQVIPEGGMLVNTRDPAALAQVGAGQAPAQGGPQPGAVEDGYRFKGGDPSDPSSWEPVGDTPPPVSAAPQRANVMRRDEYMTFVRSMGKEAADRWLASQGIRVEGF